MQKTVVGSNTPGTASSAADFGRVLGGFKMPELPKNRDFGGFFGYACGDLIFGRFFLDFSLFFARIVGSQSLKHCFVC